MPPQSDVHAFWTEIAAFDRSVTAAEQKLGEARSKLGLLGIAVARTPGGDPATLDNRLAAIRAEVLALDEALNGNVARNAINERTQPTVRSRLDTVMSGVSGSTYGPTKTHRDQFGFARAEFAALRERLTTLTTATIPAFEAELIAAGAPWVAGGAIPAPE